MELLLKQAHLNLLWIVLFLDVLIHLRVILTVAANVDDETVSYEACARMY